MRRKGRPAGRPYNSDQQDGHWVRLWVGSSLLSPNASMNCAARRACRSGSATISNTSYVTKNRFIVFANTFSTTQRDGNSIEKTHERRKLNPRTLGDKQRSDR